jgi:hypothetical protein
LTGITKAQEAITRTTASARASPQSRLQPAFSFDGARQNQKLSAIRRFVSFSLAIRHVFGRAEVRDRPPDGDGSRPDKMGSIGGGCRGFVCSVTQCSARDSQHQPAVAIIAACQPEREKTMYTHFGATRLRTHSSKCFLMAASAIGIAAWTCAGTAFAVTPTSWEVASEFNDSTNYTCTPPTATVWCYGYKEGLVLPINSFVDQFSALNDDGQTYEQGWADLTGTGGTNSQARVYHNTQPIIEMYGGNPIPAHALSLHPGADGEYATLRFTAPSRGRYRISGQFYGLNGNGIYTTTTDVHIVKTNGTLAPVPVFNGMIDVAGGTTFASFTPTTVLLAKGDTVDFEAGWGSNGNYYDDWTGLNAVIEKIR